MDFEPIVYKVYALLDAENRILNIDGGVTISNVDIATWTLIDEGTDPRKYGGCQQHYVQMPLRTMQGAYRYKLVNGKPVECTTEEIAAQEAANKPAPSPSGDLESRVSTVESDVAALTAAIEKGLAL